MICQLYIIKLGKKWEKNKVHKNKEGMGFFYNWSGARLAMKRCTWDLQMRRKGKGCWCPWWRFWVKAWREATVKGSGSDAFDFKSS